jgi:hypothetical protein
MGDEGRILSICAERDIPVSGVVMPNSNVERGYVVPVQVSRAESGKRVPGSQTLGSIKRSLLLEGINVEFLIIDNESDPLEVSLRQDLMRNFPEEIRNSFLSVNSGAERSAEVWIEFKIKPSNEAKQRVFDRVQAFANFFALAPVRINTVGEAEAATRLELLSAVRLLAPASAQELTDALRNRGTAVPSVDWAVRRLDTLRKSGLVVRRGDGRYVVTREALARLGTSKRRTSPDVRRFLDLARRGR